MDAQQECIQKLERDFHNFKKQPIPKRTIEWLKSEDEKRHAIWEKIQENHQVLRVSYPPPDYGKYYEKSVKINSEFIAKLYEWGYNTTFTQDAVSLSTIEEEGSSDESTETVKQADGSNQKQGHGESNIPPRYEEAVGCEVSTTTAEQNQSNFPPSAPIISQPLPTTTIMTTVYQTPQMNTGAIPKNIFRTYTFTPTSFVNVDPSLTPPTMTTASHSTGLKTSNNVNNSNINYNQSNTSTNFSSVDSNACGGGAALNSEPNTHNNQNNVSTTTDRNPDIVTIDGQGNIQYNYDAWKNSPNYNPDFVLSQPPINAGQSMNQPQNSGFNPNSGNPNNFINAGQSMNQPQNSGFNPKSGNPNNFINAGQSMNQPQNSGFNPNSGNPNNFINAGQSMNQPQNSGFNPNSGNPNNFINAGQSMNQPQNSGFNPNSGNPNNFINAGQSMNQPQNSGLSISINSG
ncbi:hypothetical protein PVAND_006802 [Polypedilum vanderplanki]|uniref:Uncharacterized protein n=2 Tax=Polypedilum vanderplanki TaxID=319348 RepID=A0A9J6C4U3_POLVA|nr:hypothetical protein PVAND_006802 [Polypedilum vanderplanki]